MSRLYARGALVHREGDLNIIGQAYVHSTQSGEAASELACLWAAAPEMRAALVVALDALASCQDGSPDAAERARAARRMCADALAACEPPTPPERPRLTPEAQVDPMSITQDAPKPGAVSPGTQTEDTEEKP
jgi:hypothetical protein